MIADREVMAALSDGSRAGRQLIPAEWLDTTFQ